MQRRSLRLHGWIARRGDELYRKWQSVYFALILQAEATAAFRACQNRSEDESGNGE